MHFGLGDQLLVVSCVRTLQASLRSFQLTLAKLEVRGQPGLQLRRVVPHRGICQNGAAGEGRQQREDQPGSNEPAAVATTLPTVPPRPERRSRLYWLPAEFFDCVQANLTRTESLDGSLNQVAPILQASGSRTASAPKPTWTAWRRMAYLCFASSSRPLRFSVLTCDGHSGSNGTTPSLAQK